MKQVLIATDSSDFAEFAAQLVAKLPTERPLHVYIATVLNPPEFIDPAFESEYWTVDLIEQQQQIAIRSAQRVAHMFEGTGITTEHLMLTGPVGLTLVEAANERGVDLIAIGASGHSRLTRIVLGSVSDYVATHAHCSVLVARPTDFLKDSKPWQVAVAYNASAHSHAALQEFSETSWSHDSKMTLVSVSSNQVSFLGEFPEDNDLNEQILKVLDNAAAKVQIPGASVSTAVVSDSSVGQGLVQYAEDNHCDLIVLGEKPKGFIDRMLLGSVSRYVLRHAHCSIWIARNKATTNKP